MTAPPERSATFSIGALADIANVLQSTDDPEGRIRKTLVLTRNLVPYDCGASSRTGSRAPSC